MRPQGAGMMDDEMIRRGGGRRQKGTTSSRRGCLLGLELAGRHHGHQRNLPAGQGRRRRTEKTRPDCAAACCPKGPLSDLSSRGLSYGSEGSVWSGQTSGCHTWKLTPPPKMSGWVSSRSNWLRHGGHAGRTDPHGVHALFVLTGLRWCLLMSKEHSRQQKDTPR